MKATIIGAGLTGPLLGVYLARRGFALDLYEHRPDMRKVEISAGRSINLAISTRGIEALRQVGLAEKILQESIPMKGRMIHKGSGQLFFQPYGRTEAECIYAISRGHLNKGLLDAVEAFPQVKVHFQERFLKADLSSQTLFFENLKTKKSWNLETQLVFGADGAASALRTSLATQMKKEELSHSYKELYIPPGESGEFQMEKNALHIWPRGSFMLIAIPNLDGSFTCTLFLATAQDEAQGPSFASLKDEKRLLDFFQKEFPDAKNLMPSLVHDFFQNPTGNLTTIHCSPWYYRDKALLLGDACHGIVPFYGQGMNCCFEDVSVLDELWRQNPRLDREDLFKRFQESRKTNTDAIADMALDNFLEMRDHTGNPRFLLRKEVEQHLMKKFQGSYLSQYFLVTFTRVPYSYAQKVGKHQEDLLHELCEGIDHVADLDENKVVQAFQKYKSKVDLIDPY